MATGKRDRSRHARWIAWLALGLGGLGSTCAQARAERLNIHVLSDRLTLAVARHPQVYLYGRIDAQAPQRFETLVRSGRIAAGSDVYLSAAHGDLAAGMALGRLIRAGGMATHLGAPRRNFPGASGSRTAVCVDACALAFFGGLYRWAPSGSDRLGLSVTPAAAGHAASLPPGVDDYLKEMKVDPGPLTVTSPKGAASVVWLAAEALRRSGAVNNGRLPARASYDVASPTPTLDLRQSDRTGEHRLVITCRPGQTLVEASERVGARRAREIVARGGRSYLALNGGPPMLAATDGVSAEGEMLVIRRSFPPERLVDLLFAGSIGAWVDGRSAAFRDGFALNPWGAHAQLRVFYHACWRAAPWPMPPA
ncbi:hypothetical protein [Dyella sp.]|uniref:hypothetical protein n=1 Tax=Dyella sp. TaxID=1869338 RepID=UPI002D79EF79|nr:hypothetical protein [Dyella sp.]HET6432712.1 hypothetical protein [Dyella sp.]